MPPTIDIEYHPPNEADKKMYEKTVSKYSQMHKHLESLIVLDLGKSS